MAAVRSSVCGPVSAAEVRPPVEDDGEWPISFVSLSLSLSLTRALARTHLFLMVVCDARARTYIGLFFCLFVFFSEACFVVRNRGQWGLSDRNVADAGWRSLWCVTRFTVGRSVDH